MRRVVLLLVGLLALGVAAVSSGRGTASPAVGPKVTFMSYAKGINGPYGITKGPDGAIWFTNCNYESGDGHCSDWSIGRITTNGAITLFRHKSRDDPYGITTGPDGALWFTSVHGNSIGRITTKGVMSFFRSKELRAPSGIAAGPDGALWFTNWRGGSIGRITTKGVISVYRNKAIHGPEGITVGPDGALWFTTCNDNYSVLYPEEGRCIDGSIGRITTKGAMTFFHAKSISGAYGITTGPDGALWFTNYDSIGRITTQGKVSDYSRREVAGAEGIVAGSDGALWFAMWDDECSNCSGEIDNPQSRIGRITTTGVITLYRRRIVNGPVGIAAGGNRTLWFTNYEGDSVGRLTVLAPS